MNLNLFQKWALATILATLFLIFVGGFVRASGAGLGCPDWPKCWGLWFPPSSVEAIDAARYDVTQFNAAKMWIEYANRLVGVTVGILITGTAILSLRYRKTDPPVTAGAFAALALVVFQGWLGGRVVQSGLHGGMITLHLVVAIALFCLLIWVTYRAAGAAARFVLADSDRRALRRWAAALFLACVVQIVVGAQVREAVEFAGADSGRATTPAELLVRGGAAFKLHRSFAWLLVGAAAGMAFACWRRGVGGIVRTLVATTAMVLAVQVGSGVVMSGFGLVPAAQVIHLGMSSVVCCLAFLLVVGLGRRPVLLAGAASPNLQPLPRRVSP